MRYEVAEITHIAAEAARPVLPAAAVVMAVVPAVVAPAAGTMVAIMVAAAATLHVSGITNVQTADQAAKALEPFAGSLAQLLFALGVVGLGRIGTAAALRAKALGMDVVFYDPYKPSGYEKALGIRSVDRLDDLLAQSHVLSLHCPSDSINAAPTGHSGNF